MKNTGGVLAALLGGAVVGAALGLLLAPEKGEDTRSKIVDTFDTTKEKVVEALKKRGINLDKTDLEDLVDDIKTDADDAMA
ncbi:MAG: YtxH domain-containing protein [Paludibacteraceae bacterium]